MTLSHQCWLFAVGSALFAVATAPGVASFAGVGAANATCFIGSLAFTSAAWVQLIRSGPEGSAQWYSAAVQFAGTVLFNVSTGASVLAHAVVAERRLVWAPDATGSAAFLASAALGVVAVGHWAPSARDWQAAWLNVIGCLAFAASAVGAFVYRSGTTADQALANAGTFVGAVCFLVAALVGLPRPSSRSESRRDPSR